MDFDFNRERTILGTVFTHGGEEELSLSDLDRMNHMLVIGKTGMGKTRLLKNIIVQDMHSGRGVGVIDPHGDLQDELLDEIPRRRTRDLVYLDPNDPERVVTFNVVANVPRDRIAPTTAEIVAAFKAVYAGSCRRTRRCGPRWYPARLLQLDDENQGANGRDYFAR